MAKVESSKMMQLGCFGKIQTTNIYIHYSLLKKNGTKSFIKFKLKC